MSPRRGPTNIVASADRLEAEGVEVFETGRGGDVTYHGPGQLMVYPIVRLKHGVVDFLSRVAGALADALAEVGVPGAEFVREPTGLYVSGAKIAACGIHVARGVSIHGYALETKVAEQDHALRRTLSLLIEWIEANPAQ